MRSLIRELIDQAEIICEDMRCTPSGCESCTLFKMNFKEDEEDEEFKCPLCATIDALEITGCF